MAKGVPGRQIADFRGTGSTVTRTATVGKPCGGVARYRAATERVLDRHQCAGSLDGVKEHTNRGVDMDTTFNTVRAEALFASTLQASQEPTPAQVRAAVTSTLRRHGIGGCAARVAGEFGEYPETAATRMAWALGMIRNAYEDLASREFAYAG
ncbi:hypothetical protein [Dactylosporangium sp. CA-092794]|uniref:hypothetical protein n=1 Tax=Dactylosporangium sp. CA-092794 TaxID=3239929 RepID=UPI003D8B5680